MDKDTSIHKGVYLSIIKFCEEQAKAMHKEEHLNTWLQCLSENGPIAFEDYYNETFGGDNEQ